MSPLEEDESVGRQGEVALSRLRLKSGDGATSLELVCAQEPYDALVGLWNELYASLARHRGGEALAVELGGPDALGHLIDRSQCWVVEGPEQPLALAIVRSEVLELLYVAPTERRQGIGRAIARTLIDAELVRDALALPGDRATKALYESIGWRARLLTMRGGD